MKGVILTAVIAHKYNLCIVVIGFLTCAGITTQTCGTSTWPEGCCCCLSCVGWSPCRGNSSRRRPSSSLCHSSPGQRAAPVISHHPQVLTHTLSPFSRIHTSTHTGRWTDTEATVQSACWLNMGSWFLWYLVSTVTVNQMMHKLQHRAAQTLLGLCVPMQHIYSNTGFTPPVLRIPGREHPV